MYLYLNHLTWSVSTFHDLLCSITVTRWQWRTWLRDTFILISVFNHVVYHVLKSTNLITCKCNQPAVTIEWENRWTESLNHTMGSLICNKVKTTRTAFPFLARKLWHSLERLGESVLRSLHGDQCYLAANDAYNCLTRTAEAWLVRNI